MKVIFTKTKNIPKGFTTSAMHIGFKRTKLDFAVIKSEVMASVAVMMTANKFKGAPLIVSAHHAQNGRAQAIVVNSGNANAGTGKQGIQDASEIAELVGTKCGILKEDVIVASTGIIGKLMPMEFVRDKIKELPPLNTNFVQTEQAILTTDTVTKSVSVKFNGIVIKGFAKGSGMIHPRLKGAPKHATMLCFILTDAAVAAKKLQAALKSAADATFNAISVDGETSCNDMVAALANGLSGVKPEKFLFQQALTFVCNTLAKKIAEDGEGATKVIEAKVSGARELGTAQKLALSLITSPLIKTAVYGKSPNWGRIAARIGGQNGSFSIRKMEIRMNNHCLYKNGMASEFDKEALIASLKKRKTVSIVVDLHEGDKFFTGYGCDLTEQYVAINAAYS